MGNQYTVNAGVGVGTNLPLINLTGSAAIRLRVYEWLMGFSTGPADIATLIKIVRTTGVGLGGSALTEYKRDPLTVGPTGAAIAGTFTTAPATGDELMRIAINQRATHRWIAAEGKELVAAATADNGIEFLSVSSGGNPTCELTIYWDE